MSRPIRLALVLALVMLVPATAFAAGTTGRTATSTPSPSAKPSTPVTSATPAPLAVPASLDIQLWPSEADGVNLIVSAEIPDSVKLPATVRLPIPAGLTLGWVGEVFGGDTSKDVQRPYTTEDGTGGRVIVLTVSQSRIVQYEGLLSQPTQDGTRFSAKLAWVQSAPSASQAWAVKMIASTGDVKTTPAFVGAPQVNAVGERLYTLPSTQLAVGKTQDVTVSFVRGETSGTPAPAQQSTGSSVVLYVLFGLLGVAVVALIIVVSRPRARRV